jgi:hypothetical protein
VVPPDRCGQAGRPPVQPERRRRNKGNGKARRELPNVSAAEVEQAAAIADAPVSAPMKIQAGARKARREVLRASDRNNPEIRQLIPDVEGHRL